MAPTLLDQLPLFQGPVGVALAAVGLLVVVVLVLETALGTPYPEGIPLVREPVGARRFSVRTRLAYYIDCKALYHDAYVNYSKQGKAVVVPGLGFSHSVVMPGQAMRWILAQPDAAFSPQHAFADIDQIYWSMGHEEVVLDAWQGHLVKTDLNRVLESICAAMNDELAHLFDEHFGTDTDNWKEIQLNSTVQMIVAQAASRFTVGLPLCRNQDYIRTSLALNQCLVANAGITGSVPRLFKPLVGTLVNLPTRWFVARLKQWTVPLWRERLETLKHADHDEPQDIVQMMVRFAQRERPHELADADLCSRRLFINNFGSMHQTVLQVTNLLLNVLGSDAAFNTVAVLRDEADRVLGDSPDWTKAKVSQLWRADSCARETLRLNSFGGRASFRKVLVDGVVTEDGHGLPRGTILCLLSQPAHCDDDTYDDAARFDPFRFSRAREAAAARGETAPPATFVTTGPDFLAFSHGKHACPGRFLVDFEMKMILAYMLRNYDVKFPDRYGGKRPENYWMAEALFPPDNVGILVKRRTPE